MASFVALYRGTTIGEARVVAVSSDPRLVAHVASELLDDPLYADQGEPDSVLAALSLGKQQALRLIRDGAE